MASIYWPCYLQKKHQSPLVIFKYLGPAWKNLSTFFHIIGTLGGQLEWERKRKDRFRMLVIKIGERKCHGPRLGSTKTGFLNVPFRSTTSLFWQSGWIQSLLPDPAAPGAIPSVSNKFSEEKIVDVVEVSQQSCLEESGQWLENIEWNRLVQASGKLVLQKNLVLAWQASNLPSRGTNLGKLWLAS